MVELVQLSLEFTIHFHCDRHSSSLQRQVRLSTDYPSVRSTLASSSDHCVPTVYCKNLSRNIAAILGAQKDHQARKVVLRTATPCWRAGSHETPADSLQTPTFGR